MTTSTLEPDVLQRRRMESSSWRERWLGLRERATSQGDSLAVEVGSPWMMDCRKLSAAAPRVQQESEGSDTILRLHMPGARRGNTQVVWCEPERRLVVGVWAGDIRDRSKRGVVQPRLVWYRSTRLPEGDGKAASARVRRGIVEVRVPAARE